MNIFLQNIDVILELCERSETTRTLDTLAYICEQFRCILGAIDVCVHDILSTEHDTRILSTIKEYMLQLLPEWDKNYATCLMTESPRCPVLHSGNPGRPCFDVTQDQVY